MPQLRLELHGRRSKRIFVGYCDIHFIFSAFVRSAHRSHEGTCEMVYIISDELDFDSAMRIILQLLEFFCDPASAVGAHDVK